MAYPSLASNAISDISWTLCSAVHWLFASQNITFGAVYLALAAIVGENRVQYILLSCVTHGSSNVPLLIVIGCAYMELLFLQSEWELHWPRGSLDAIRGA